jgi:hypothetical protein
MWYIGYTNQWLKKLIEKTEKSGIDLSRSYFALIIFESLQRELQEFINEFYYDLNDSSSLPLQIIAPIKPPKSITGDDTFGPDNPLESHEEKQSFFRELKEKNISIYPLPKVIFFNIKKKDKTHYEMINLKSIRLDTIEYKRSSRSYREFFSALSQIASDCYNSNKTSDEFYKIIRNKFGPIFLEEKIVELPVIGRIYEKRIG